MNLLDVYVEKYLLYNHYKYVIMLRLEYQVVHVDPTIVTRTITAITTPSTITEAIFSGLRPYTRYRVRVVAVNQAMKEGTSMYGEVTTLPAPPSELSKLEAVPISGGTSLLVTWSEPALPNGNVRKSSLYFSLKYIKL